MPNTIELTGYVNYDYGYITSYLENITPENRDQTYVLYRSNYPESSQLDAIAILDASNDFTYIDKMVEQGQMYWYATCMADQDVVNLITNDEFLAADFEDVILSDKTGRSLRIRFNPKVTALKSITQEQKIETIGNQYPFFFKNGRLKYREIPLTGLISMEMDEWFYPALDAGELALFRGRTPSPKTSGRTQREIYFNERKYKLEVEKWLTNGEPKVLRSPTEGNFIVKLMNISLAPEEQLARKLHTFSATAYEVAPYTLQELYNYGFYMPDGLHYDPIVTGPAGLGKYGRICSSNGYNSVTIEQQDYTLELNKFFADRIIGSDVNIEIIIGEKAEEEAIPQMFRMTRSGGSTAAITPATNETPGLVRASTDRNYLNVNDSGEAEISSVGFECFKAFSDLLLGALEDGYENVVVTPEYIKVETGVLQSVKGNLSGEPNVFIADQGAMKVEDITMDKVIWTHELVIGGN